MVHYFFQAALEATEEVAAEAHTVLEPAANANLISQGLQITLVGMGILFVSLFILWGVMELLVRLVKDGKKDDEEEETSSAVVEAAETDDELKLKAAAAAAAYITAKK